MSWHQVRLYKSLLSLQGLEISNRLVSNMSTPRLTRSASRQSLSNSTEALAPKANISKPRAKKETNGVAQASPKKPTAKRSMEPPSTPTAKRTKKIAVPSTPTPAAVTSMSGLYSTGDIDDPIPSKKLKEDRPAEPHVTNAPLKTPKGSRVVAYTKKTAEESPSKTGLPRPTTTTGHLLEEACAHLLKIDPNLKAVIEKHHCKIFAPEGLAEEIDPFRSLVSGIMAQQVSGAAASSIKRKFIGLFNDHESNEENWQFPTPAQVAPVEITFLRTAGLSERKAEYVKGLAEKFNSGELSAKMLVEASYEDVLEKLTAVRGLGKWSVEMFACFGLKRMDVFSTGDLGVQ